MRTCDCSHAFPLCGCCEGLMGKALLDRSRHLSVLAGYPARVSIVDALFTLFEHARPLMPHAGGCGCGRG